MGAVTDESLRLLPVTRRGSSVTAEDIIYHRRVRVLDYAAQVGVAAACRAFGISRTTYYRWENRARRYGLSALLPKARRKPVMPNAMTPEEVSTILAEAVANPTLGARQLAVRLAARGVHRSPSGIHKILVRRNLGTRSQRVAALASITAAEQGCGHRCRPRGPVRVLSDRYPPG
jgi:transposase-like protein